MNCIGGLLYSALLRTTVEVRTFHVDETYIAAQKAAAKASGASAFVSTNDVITSWFLQRGGFGLGMMAVNFRGRLPDAPMSLAGNYESVVLYRLADVATPSLLRRSLAKLRRAATPSTDLPSSREHLGLRCGMVSNWSSFAKPVELPGASQARADKPVACMVAGSPHILVGLPAEGELVGEPVAVTA
ncbi:hypothetical protein EMIHUDRAFT_444879 [Emiliania huxleyi CCMP1516]|uniref:Uncharacterized protein n=2 Tax=Emiliania huxleyi TaxID=2903 RepID=A0A0D3J821_EMIH1|nr:hypothetical protein EMIHUDRAFT_444879 [Emiliania huxleyi CCMP1516]EOD19656.1 hypothetical protein EMIHUDRAFT_444879 [Emiliania huxleyi CCMP1516]|eukprot:XP_005772085.1 hypothetical protein EMIHUDRAFT_444879 [Emiliania huxleyi CCMP1516]